MGLDILSSTMRKEDLVSNRSGWLAGWLAGWVDERMDEQVSKFGDLRA